MDDILLIETSNLKIQKIGNSDFNGDNNRGYD